MPMSMGGTIERCLPNGDWVALTLPSAFFDDLDATALVGWLIGQHNVHDLPMLQPDPKQEVVGDIYSTYLFPLGQLARFDYTQAVEDRRNPDYTKGRVDPLPRGKGAMTTYAKLFGKAWMLRVDFFRLCNPHYRMRCWFYTT